MTWFGKMLGATPPKRRARSGFEAMARPLIGRCGAPFEPTMRLLEPRFMFDAAGAATVVTAQNQANHDAAPTAANTDHAAADHAATDHAAPAPSAPAPAATPAPAPEKPSFTAAPDGAGGTAFTAQGNGYGVTASAKGIEVTAGKGDVTLDLGMRWVGGADAVQPTAAAAPGDTPGQSATTGAVRYANIYQGVDMVVYGNAQRNIEYDLSVAAGADAGRIALRFTGAQSLSLDTAGNLEIAVAGGEVTEHTPVAYQIIDGKRVDVTVAYALKGDNTIGFTLGAYDTGHDLIIDPSVSVTEAPTLSVNVLNGAVSGVADTPIPLAIGAALTADEIGAGASLSVTLDGIPAHATLTDAAHHTLTVVSGHITLSPTDLDGLTLTPNAGDPTDFTVRVTATTTDIHGTASTYQDVAVSVAPGAPTLTINDINGTVTGTADTPIPILIDAALTGTEAAHGALTVTISGIPPGASLANAGGPLALHGLDSITLDASQLAGLTITPNAGDGAAFTLTVTAIDTDNGETNSVSQDIMGTVLPAAPTLSIGDINGAIGGAVDTAIPLNIAAVLTGSEAAANAVLTVTISGIPDNAVLTNANGEQWSGVDTIPLTPDQLTGLTITPSANDALNATLRVDATVDDGLGNTTTVSRQITLTLTPAAPALMIASASISGPPGVAIPLNIDTALTGSEASTGLTPSVTLSGIPSGAVLMDANGQVVPLTAGSVTLSEPALAGLTVTTTAGFTLHAVATVTDRGVIATTGAQDIAVGVLAAPVTVNDIAASTTLTGGDVTGPADTAIPLNIDATMGLTTQGDGGSISVTISGLPPGVAVSNTAGDAPQTADGSGVLVVDYTQLAGLSIMPADQDAGVYTLTVNATTTDPFLSTTTVALPAITLTIGHPAPALATHDATGVVGGAIPISVTLSPDELLADTATVTITNIPGTATLANTAGDLPALVGGALTLRPDQLAGLSITPTTLAPLHLGVTVTTSDGGLASQAITLTVREAPPTLTIGNPSVFGTADTVIPLTIDATVTGPGSGITITGLPLDAVLTNSLNGTLAHGGSITLTTAQLAGLAIRPLATDLADFTLHVTATSADGSGANVVSRDIAVSVAPGAPSLSVAAIDGALAATADVPLPLTISAALAGTEVGHGTLSVTISDIPSDAVLKNASGAVLPLTLDPLDPTLGSITLTATQLAGLTLTPSAADGPGFRLHITATNSDGGETNAITRALAITVAPAAPSLTVIDSGGVADQPIPLTIAPLLTGTEASSPTSDLMITIDGIPPDAVLTNIDGVVPVTSGGVTLTMAQLAGLAITVTAADEPNFSLQITATVSDNGVDNSVTRSMLVSVTPIAPTLSVADASGTVGTAIPLAITTAPGGSEGAAPGSLLSVTLSGVPGDAALSNSAGDTLIPDSPGTYILSSTQLTGLTITPLNADRPGFTLHVLATTSNSGGVITTSGDIVVSVAPAAAPAPPPETPSDSTAATTTPVATVTAPAPPPPPPPPPAPEAIVFVPPPPAPPPVFDPGPRAQGSRASLFLRDLGEPAAPAPGTMPGVGPGSGAPGSPSAPMPPSTLAGPSPLTSVDRLNAESGSVDQGLAAASLAARPGGAGAALRVMANSRSITSEGASAVFNRMSASDVVATVRNGGLPGAAAVAGALSRVAGGEKMTAAQFQSLLSAQGVGPAAARAYLAAFQRLGGGERAAPPRR